MGKYLVENPVGVAVLQTIDRLLPDCKSDENVPMPSSLLISNLAHLGDAVVTTAVLRALKDAAPAMKIGVLCGSWNRPVFEGHPCVDKVHFLDHWKLNRSALPAWKKVQLYRKMFRAACGEVKREKYDASVDFYPYFPNAIPLLWKAKVPVRIGYESGGFGPVLTHRLQGVDLNRSAGENFYGLLKHFLPLPDGEFSIRPCLPKVDLPFKEVREKEYIVFHMGTGYHLKEWPEDKWRALAQRLLEKGENIVFTGRGKEEKARIERVSGGKGFDFCDRADWGAFTALIAHAKAIVTVDSVSVHAASAFGVPAVVLFSGISPLSFWNSGNPNGRVLMRPLPCAPCLDRRGCASMACIREISVEDVLQAL